jgi:hypothetical protein
VLSQTLELIDHILQIGYEKITTLFIACRSWFVLLEEVHQSGLTRDKRRVPVAGIDESQPVVTNGAHSCCPIALHALTTSFHANVAVDASL